MAKTSKARLICYDYIAHIQRKDGTTVEIAGTRAARSQADVYAVLCNRALALEGHLVTQSITETDKTDSEPWEDDAKTPAFLAWNKEKHRRIEALSPEPAKNVVETKKDDSPYVFHNTDIFGTFDKTYIGANAVTFRPRSET